MKAFLLTIVILAWVVVPIAKAGSTADRVAIARIEKRLHNLIIPNLEFREATFPEALDFLKMKSREIGGKASSLRTGGFQNLYASTPSSPSNLPAVPETRGEEEPRNTSEQSSDSTKQPKRISITLKNVSLYDALTEITSLAGVKFWIRPDGVHTSLNEKEPMFTWDFYVPHDFFEYLEASDLVDQAGLARLWKSDVQSFLIMNGVSFEKTAAAILNDERTRLTVHNTESELELVDTIIKSFTAELRARSAASKGKPKAHSAAGR